MSQRQSTEMAQPGSEVQDTTNCNFFPCKLFRDVKSRLEQRREQKYSVVPTMVFAVIGAVLYVVDVISDMGAAVKHRGNGDWTWFVLTVVIIGWSSTMVVAFGLRQFIIESDDMSWLKRVEAWIEGKTGAVSWAKRHRLMVVLMAVPVTTLAVILSPLLGLILTLKGYWDTLSNGWKSRQCGKQGNTDQQEIYYKKILSVNGGSARMRLVECFLEAAPQYALQVYIMTQISAAADPSKYNSDWWNGQYVTTITSWVSLAWGLTAYTRSQREADENRSNMSLSGSIVFFLWRLSWLAARVTAVVVFAAHFQDLVEGAFIGHVLLMAAWLMVTRTFKDDGTTMRDEMMYSGVSGLLYIFDFLPWNSKPHQPTRRHYAFYYYVCEVENVFMVIMFLWYAAPCTWYYIPATVIHFVSFPSSLLFMGLYYQCLHPSLNQPLSQPAPQNVTPLSQHIPDEGEDKTEEQVQPHGQPLDQVEEHRGRMGGDDR